MEATVVSIGKSVLVGALGYARSKAAEEVALQLGVEGDVAFIADELEMMQSFLMTADEERGQRKVLATWVKHVRDLAYNVEDSLMDFSLLSEKKKSWWRSPRTAVERRRIAMEMKKLRAKVEDVSNRNLRYRHIDESSGSKPTAAEEQAIIATAALFGINEARVAALEHEKSSVVDLHQLITGNGMDLRVVAVWGTSGELGKTSAIQEVYNDPTICSTFGFRAWVRLANPFNPQEFIHSLVRQFYESSPENLGEKRKKETIGSNVLMKMNNMSQSEMVDVFDTQVNDTSYLIVIDDLSTIVEWSCIKTFFPDNKKRSRIIVSTQQAEIASLCTEQPYQVSELKQLSSDQTLYLFHKKINSEEEVSTAGVSAEMFGINEIKLAAQEEVELNVGLRELINDEEKDLRVIVVKETGGDNGKLSVIKEVYDDPTVNVNFGLCAWVTLMHPFNPKELIQNFLRQFTKISPDELGDAEESTSDVPNKVEAMEQSDLACVFDAQVRDNSYLFVINDLSTVEEWDCIKEYFVDYKRQSRIIISTRQGVEITGLCTDQPYQMIELEQLSSNQTLCTFHDKNSEDQVSIVSTGAATSDTRKARLTATEKEKMKENDDSEIQAVDQPPKNASEQPKKTDEGKAFHSTARKKLDRSRTVALDEFLCGRETEKSFVIKLIVQPDTTQGCLKHLPKVISVWGMGGLGKTTLVRSIYRSQQLGGWKRAWATALRPFNPEVLLRDLALQLQKSIQDDPAAATEARAQKKNLAVMKNQELKDELARLLQSQKCLVVLDDISSISEWESVKSCLVNAGRIIVTTREKNIAENCSRDYGSMYSLQGLKGDAAFDLFIKKVFNVDSKEKDLPPAMMEQARLILKKCNGLPLGISTIGGFLATKPKTAIEWRKMNEHVSAELEINPELRIIKTILMRSYDGLPYHLKSVFLYLSIFPEDHKIMWGRLLRRWIAEGYLRDMHGMTAEELGRRYFDELLDRSMILPGEYSGKISSCQLHDMIREICISKAREENLVFTLEDGCCLNNTQGPIRHLVIGSNWKRDKDVLRSMLDLSHVRSLTVFGEWRPFFISDNMRFLRVLDLEDTLGLRDHHLDQIGQLLHLKYLSLRRCENIYSLPDSLGNLRQLESLDVRGTCIFELPSSITKLRKLQHFQSSGQKTVDTRDRGILYDYSYYVDHFFTERIGSCGILISTGPLLLRPQILDDDLNRSDIVNLHRFAMAHVAAYNGGYFKTRGVQIPRGVGKLKALQTLRHINIVKGKGKVALKELEELTQLRKLGVVAVTIKNSKVLWSAIAGLNQLRSLSVETHEDSGVVDGCLGEGLSPPSCLQSLKLTGRLVRMTAWIHLLQNLSKLTLEDSRLQQDDSIQALGVLANLALLRLNSWSFKGRQLHFQNSSFRSLVVLELSELPNLESVLFEEDAMPMLELLQVAWCRPLKEISGLPVLTSLREIRLDHCVSDELKEEVQRQVAEHLKHVRLNISI